MLVPQLSKLGRGQSSFPSAFGRRTTSPATLPHSYLSEFGGASWQKATKQGPTNPFNRGKRQNFSPFKKLQRNRGWISGFPLQKMLGPGEIPKNTSEMPNRRRGAQAGRLRRRLKLLKSVKHQHGRRKGILPVGIEGKYLDFQQESWWGTLYFD